MSGTLTPEEEAAMDAACFGSMATSLSAPPGSFRAGWLAARRYDRAEMVAKRAQIANYILAEMTHDPGHAISAAYRAADAIIAGDVSKWPRDAEPGERDE